MKVHSPEKKDDDEAQPMYNKVEFHEELPVDLLTREAADENHFQVKRHSSTVHTIRSTYIQFQVRRMYSTTLS